MHAEEGLATFCQFRLLHSKKVPLLASTDTITQTRSRSRLPDVKKNATCLLDEEEYDGIPESFLQKYVARIFFKIIVYTTEKKFETRTYKLAPSKIFCYPKTRILKKILPGNSLAVRA